MSVSNQSDFLASFSDDENDLEDVEGVSPVPADLSYEGTLSKWTNYLHGWQSRYLVLRDGTLSYYKSEFDTGYGCRGSVSIAKAAIEVHEFDNCRFDVNVGDCVYYLRADGPAEKQNWVEILESAKQAESGYGSEQNLPKAISTLSLSSQPSLRSSSSFQKSAGLREKLMEIETFRDILCRQTDTLQAYFDSCAEKCDSSDLHQKLDLADDEIEPDNDDLAATPTPSSFMRNAPPSHSIDFRGEAITFKATTAGVIQVLSHCIDLMTKREEYWKRKVEREQEKVRKLTEQLKSNPVEVTEQQFCGPDFMEGPNMKLNEEQFFDAVDTALDVEDENDDDLENIDKENVPPPKPASEIMSAPKHKYTKMLETKVKDNLVLIQEPVDAENTEWYNVYEDGDLKVYRKDVEEAGLACDPLKASHIIHGVSGHEMCHYFFDKDVRLDWEVTVEKVKLLEKLSENTAIFQQIHKRIWPSAQRDTCFISHIRQLGKDEVEKIDKEIGNPWTVMNISMEHEKAANDKFVRAVANVVMLCQTFTIGDVKKKKYNRENIACKLTYMAQVNPGGWAPASAIRQVAKREYPKFLRKFSSYVQTVTIDKPLML